MCCCGQLIGNIEMENSQTGTTIQRVLQQIAQSVCLCDSRHTHSRCFHELCRGKTNVGFQNLMMLLFEACMCCCYEMQTLINGKVNDQENYVFRLLISCLTF